jgi:hypothetical protein
MYNQLTNDKKFIKSKLYNPERKLTALNISVIVTTFTCVFLCYYVNIKIKFNRRQHLSFYYITLWLHASALLGHLQAIQALHMKQNYCVILQIKTRKIVLHKVH